MAQFLNIKELLNLLANNRDLISMLFGNRRQVVSEEAAIEKSGSRAALLALSEKGIIRLQLGEVMLEEQLQEFLERMLGASEELNIASVEESLANLQNYIRWYNELPTDGSALNAKEAWMKKIVSGLGFVGALMLNNVNLMTQQIEEVYQHEASLVIKRERLEIFRAKRANIEKLVNETEEMLESTPLFLTSADTGLNFTIAELRVKLGKGRSSLVYIQRNLVEYLASTERVEHDLKHLHKLAYAIEQLEDEAKTTLYTFMANCNDLPLQPAPQWPCKLNLAILDEPVIRKEIAKISKKEAGFAGKRAMDLNPVPSDVLDNSVSLETETLAVLPYEQLLMQAKATGQDLFNFMLYANLGPGINLSVSERIELFASFAAYYDDELKFQPGNQSFSHPDFNLDYALIYAPTQNKI